MNMMPEMLCIILVVQRMEQKIGVIITERVYIWSKTHPVFVRGKDAVMLTAIYKLLTAQGTHKPTQRRFLHRYSLQFLWSHLVYNLSLHLSLLTDCN